MEGLRYLGEKDYAHRDIKPENIMFADSEAVLPQKVRICDFGLATNIESKEYLYKRCGTPGYVAPEIVKADASDLKFRLTPKCDVFSAGVIMHLLISREG